LLFSIQHRQTRDGTNTWWSYEVPGIILLCDLTVHISTCASYDFNTLTAVVWKLWRW